MWQAPPTLYVAKAADGVSQAAITLLNQAGCKFHLCRVSATHGVAIKYGLPHLTVRSSHFHGLAGIRIFLANGQYLHCLPTDHR